MMIAVFTVVAVVALLQDPVHGSGFEVTDLNRNNMFTQVPSTTNRRFMDPVAEQPKTLNLSRMPHITFLLGLAREILTLAGNPAPPTLPGPSAAMPSAPTTYVEQQQTTLYQHPPIQPPTRTFLEQPPVQVEATASANAPPGGSTSPAGMSPTSGSQPPQVTQPGPDGAPGLTEPATVKRFMF